MHINETLLREAADTAGVSLETARKWLEKAIKLHEAHMAGKAPTTGPDGEKSQQKMMDQMVKALSALGGKGGSEMKMKEAAAGELSAIMSLVRAAIIAKLYPGETNRYVSIKAFFIDRAVVSAENGRLLAFPYTLTDANVVEIGAPEEVIEHYMPVAAMREAQGVFIEAQDEKGLKWRIRVIKAGLSGNKNYYPDAVLREAVSLFNGARVFVKSDDEHIDGKGKSFRNLIGRLSNAAFIDGRAADSGEIQADLEILASAGDVPAKMLEAWNRKMTQDLFGFSVDVNGRVKLDNGRRVAQKFTKVNSVDLIIEPGAGGQLINLIEAKDPLQEGDMKLRDRMIEAIKKANNGKLPDGLDIENDEQLETAYREALGKNTPDDDKDERAKAAKAAGGKDAAGNAGVTREELEAHTRMVEARAHLRAAVADSKLPEHAKDRVRAMFADRDRFTEAQVDQAIKDEREYLGKFIESGKISGLGDLDIKAGQDRSEKVIDMLDAFFDPAHKDHRKVQSFKECYAEITGDRLVTGRIDHMDRTRLREAIGAEFRESLDSTSLSNVLGNAITRRMVAEYRAAVDYDGYRKIVNVVSVNDFRTQERVRMGGYGDLPAVAQGAPYAALASPTDEKATYAVTKRGGTEDVTLEMIKNDDVGAIRRIPVKLGRSAKRTLAKFVFDFIKDNPVIYDGLALFHATHGNLGSAALDATSLAARRLAMLKQAELNSADRLGIGPKYLLVALDGQENAVNLFNRNTNNDKTFVQSMTLEIIPVWYWTDANDWALSADPLDVPGFELGFLDGNEEPELFVQDNPTVGSMFTNDKLTYKMRHIYSGTPTDFRQFDKSVVA